MLYNKNFNIDKEFTCSKELQSIIENYRQHKKDYKQLRLDLYLKTKKLLYDESSPFSINRKPDMQDDAAEYDQIIYNGVPYKKAYHVIKYKDNEEVDLNNKLKEVNNIKSDSRRVKFTKQKNFSTIDLFTDNTN